MFPIVTKAIKSGHIGDLKIMYIDICQLFPNDLPCSGGFVQNGWELDNYWACHSFGNFPGDRNPQTFGFKRDNQWLLLIVGLHLYWYILYWCVVLTAIEKGKNGTTHHRRSIRRRADHCPGAREGRIHGVEYDPRAWNRHLDELGPGAWPAGGLA